MDYQIGVFCWLIFVSLSSASEDINISQKVSRLEALMSEMVEQNTFLKNEMEIQRTEIQKLNAENTALKRDVAYIKELFNGQFDAQVEIPTKEYEPPITNELGVVVNEQKNSSIPTTNATTVKKQITRKRRIIAPTTIAATSQARTPVNEVGFYAVMSDHNEQLGTHQTLKFQTIFTNIGNGFDVSAGIFKAPVRGLYYFTANLMTHYNEDFEAEMVKNAVSLVTCYVGNGDTFGSSSLDAVLYLEAGDDVWVQINKSGYNDGNVRVYGYGFSWFLGFLITTG